MLSFRRVALPFAIAALALPVLGAGSAARALDLPPLRSDRPPYFTADVAISLDAEGHPALAVSITLPHPELSWLKLSRGYAAGVEFIVAFEPLRPGRIYGTTWERKLVVPNFEATRASALTVVEKQTLDIPPGRYQVRVLVRDLNSESESSASDHLEVPDYSRVPLGFADLELGVIDSTAGFQPVPTRRFGLNVSKVAARVLLFDRRPGSWPRHYAFHYRLLDEMGAEAVEGSVDAVMSRSADPVVVRPTSSDLFLGTYVFEVELVEGKSRWRVDRSFEVEESGPPRGKEWDRMLEPLSYIATGNEIDHLRNLPPEQQVQGWEEFWRRRDPTPDTPRNEAMLEFFRRLKYTEQHFQGFGPGWRSDMGRIYIKFGPPDQIENRPATATSSQIEVWYYNQPYRRFVFTDRDGFGRFVLISPSLE